MADVASETTMPAPKRSRSPETAAAPAAATAVVPASETAGETAVAAPAPKVRKVVRKKRRPARPQVDPATFKTEPPPQTGVTFNIWYNKWSGGDRETGQASQTAAKGRCNIAQDSGYTLADTVPGSYFCLFFARGLCPKGCDCPYLHRLPAVTDLFNPNVDCFGRDKFSDYRDDMGGVGSFLRPNRTLYVGRIHVSDDIEEVVARHFAEWGPVERIRVLNARGVAFVTYVNEANAQFAKEAMAHQALDHGEVLNVRWATVDPNPMAQAREARRVEEQAAAAIRAVLPADYVAELEGRDPAAAKRRRVEGSFGLPGYEAPDKIWYARRLEGGGGGAAAAAGGEAAATNAIEYAPATDGAAGATSEVTAPPSGLLSGATLAALERHRERSHGLVVKTAKTAEEAKPVGALVDYSSGSDDDES